MESIVITGVAGFIGSNLTKFLLENSNYSIIGIDNLSTGRIENIKPIINNPRFKFFEKDILEFHNLEISKPIKACIHLAAFVSVPKSFEQKDICLKVNIEGTNRVLNFCVENKVPKFIYASSAAVYGEPKKTPIKESFPLNPLSPYAESKVQNEIDAGKLSKKGNIKTTGLRFFNVYGPNQNLESNYGSVIPSFIRSIRTRGEVKIFGDGRQTRDFIFIDDLSKAIQLLIEEEILENNLILNISAGKETTILELAQLVSEIEEIKSNVTFHPIRKGDIKNSLADNSKSTKLIGVYTHHNLLDGLKITCKSYSFP